jgi:hypothetical protein
VTVADKVSRNIFFYRVVSPVDGIGKRKDVDVAKVLAALEANTANPAKRYWIDSGETHLSKVDGKDRVRFAYTRRSTLPQVEENGEFSNLDLKKTAGLADSTHIRFFPDSVAGADFNIRGPGAVRFGHFITATTAIRVDLQPLLKADVLKDLDLLKDVTLVSLKVNTAYAHRVRRYDQDLGSAIQATRRAAGDGVVELRLTPPRYSRNKSVQQSLLDRLRRIASDPAAGEYLYSLKVEGRSAAGDIDLNLLREKLVYRSAILTVDTRHRILDVESAYAAIGTAYSEIKDDIEAAVSIG